MGFTGRFSPDAIRKTGRVILATQIRPDELLVAGAATGTPQLRRAALQHWADYLDRLCHDADRELLPRRR